MKFDIQFEAILLHSRSGEDFLLKPADEFDREVAILGNSKKFLSFLETRAREIESIPISKIRQKHDA